MLIPMKEVTEKWIARGNIKGIIHAGAHLAEEAIDYRSAGVQNVLWIEGNPDKIAPLRQRLRHYQKSILVYSLVGSHLGEETLNVANNGQSSSILELGTHEEAHPEVHYVGQRKVQMRTIDDIVDEFGVGIYNFMNLDLQGYELEALKGACETLPYIDVIYTEVNTKELYKGCALVGDLDDFLTDFTRVQTTMAGKVGWGDAVYVRTEKL